MWKLMRIFILLLLLIPVFSWLSWKLEDRSQINLLVIDKTTPDPNYSEHLSFFWLANQNRWVKPNGDVYDFAKDFYGFHAHSDGSFTINDLSELKQGDLKNIADSLDVAYFADTYGIYNSNWKGHPDYGKDTISFLYGGLQPEDFNLLRELKRRGKTIIAEFNLFASPTSAVIRHQTEQLLGVRWSGWVGKHYSTLDTLLDPEIPKWLPALYRKNYKQKYKFTNSGIVLVDNHEHIIILEDKKDLNQRFPVLESELSTQLQYNVPEKIYYPYWFEINTTDDRNYTLASFHIDVTKSGKALMDAYHVPTSFPAIIEHDKKYHFLYFACDFSDNPMGIYSSYFKGIEKLSGAFYSPNQVKDRKMFFWTYYRPFMETVMDSISARKRRKLRYVD